MPKGVPRIGRKRWGPLCAFLTAQMKTASSERVKMQAALRLADIYMQREQKETMEIKRELLKERRAEKAEAAKQPDVVPAQPVSLQERVEEFIARLNKPEATNNE